LAVFYYSTNGDRWFTCIAPSDFSDPAAIEGANNNCDIPISIRPQEQLPLDSGSDAWLTPSSECEWMGVVCNGNDVMYWLQLSDNGLTGSINSELGQLSELRILRLPGGVITDPIPNIFDQLPELEFLDLSSHLISGPIPNSIYGLINLEELVLRQNRISGEISPAIGRLLLLERLLLDDNQLTGSIPTELGFASSLEEATFDTNFLQGAMPDSVCDLKSDPSNPDDEKNLIFLTADCIGGGGPFVGCDCCNNCG